MPPIVICSVNTAPNCSVTSFARISDCAIPPLITMLANPVKVEMVTIMPSPRALADVQAPHQRRSLKPVADIAQKKPFRPASNTLAKVHMQSAEFGVIALDPTCLVPSNNARLKATGG